MSDQLLTIGKFTLLGFLYLFFARVLWAVWSEVRGPRQGRVAVDAQAATVATPRPDPGVRRASKAPKAPKPPKGPRGAATKLVVLEPRERKGATFAITHETTIGRAPECAISVPDDTFASQLHLRLSRGEGGTFAEDLGSTNGSFLNGRRIVAREKLSKGDRLQVGSTVWEAH